MSQLTSVATALTDTCWSCGGRVPPSTVTMSSYMATSTVEYRCSACGAAWQEEITHQLLTHLLSHQSTPEPEPEPEPAEPPPVIHGSVLGYRAWRIVDWQLYGTGVNRAWVPGVNEATCDAGTVPGVGMWITFGPPPNLHPAPAEGCHCGITALARFDKDDSHWRNADVFGAIEAWSDELVHSAEPGDVAAAAGVEIKGAPEPEPHGRFFLHRNGFRAQYGKVVLLAVDDDWPSAKRAAVRALAADHRADVCKFSHLEDAAKEHGQLVPEDMLKWAGEVDPDPVSERVLTLGGGGTFIVPVFGSRASNFWAPSVYSTQSERRLKRPARPRGIKRTLGHPGPPGPGTGNWTVGDRIMDSKGKIWKCMAGGKPGHWLLEDSA